MMDTDMAGFASFGIAPQFDDDNNNNNNNNHDDEEEEGVVLLGEQAELSVLRQALQTPATASIATDQFLNNRTDDDNGNNNNNNNNNENGNNSNEFIRHPWTSVRVALSQDEPNFLLTTNSGLEPAQILVTNQRLIVVGDATTTSAVDAIIDSPCIPLHALMDNGNENDTKDEPEKNLESSPGIYVQVAPNSNDNEQEDPAPLEFRFHTDTAATAQALYRALTELTSGGGGMDGEPDDDDDGWIVAAPSEATPEERQAALDRLDDLLVVPPEYRIDDDEHDDDEKINGQFDDAEEEDDGLL